MGRVSLGQRQKDYLCDQYNLDPRSLESLLEDLSRFFPETPVQFIHRRHEELQMRKWPNSLIFPQICRELEEGLFRAEEFTERQIRRQIYG